MTRLGISPQAVKPSSGLISTFLSRPWTSGLRDPPWVKLRRLDVAIEGCHGKQVREAVVGVFRADILLRSEFPSRRP